MHLGPQKAFQEPNPKSWALFISMLQMVLMFQLGFSSSAGASSKDHSLDHLLQEQVRPLMQKAWDPTSQKILAVGLVSVWGANGQDQRIQEQWRDHQKISASNSDYGDKLVTYGIGPMIAVTQYFFDRENSYSHMRALISTTLVTGTMKWGFGRERPDQSDHYSFPSGHSSSAFTSATSLTYAYGWKAAVVAYPVATFVALSRLADNKHWFSDVMAGAFIGMWMGRASFFNSSELKPQSWILLPVIENQSVGALYKIEF
jgi:hypothetical protein